MDGGNLPDWASAMVSELDQKMRFELLEASAERVVGRMPVRGNTQPEGLWHGGASGVLVETLASIGALGHGQPNRMPVGVDLNVTHHKAAFDGWVTGEALAIHLGRTSACYEVILRNDDGQRVATGRLTCALLPINQD